jgi:hypothetical protein
MREHLPKWDDTAVRVSWYLIGLMGIAISVILAIAGILR